MNCFCLQGSSSQFWAFIHAAFFMEESTFSAEEMAFYQCLQSQYMYLLFQQIKRYKQLSQTFVILSSTNINNCMFSNRLQQTLNARVELIQNLLLIYSFSQLVNLRMDVYQRDNQNIYQKEMLLLQSYQNIFKIDQKFSRLFYNLVCKIFGKLNKSFKGSPLTKGAGGKIRAAYLSFISFFKFTKELQIVRYLQKIEIDSVSQSQLFFILTSALIKYMKIKTDAIITKLKDKTKKQDLNFYEERTIQFIDLEKNVCKKRQEPTRSRLVYCGRIKKANSSISSRRYNSEQLPKIDETARRGSKQLLRKTAKQSINGNEDLQIKNASANWKVSINKFKDIYVQQWQQYYKLLTPIIQDLEQLRYMSNKLSSFEKKQWTSTYYNGIYRQLYQRNQGIVKAIKAVKIRESPAKRKSVERILRQ